MKVIKKVEKQPRCQRLLSRLRQNLRRRKPQLVLLMASRLKASENANERRRATVEVNAKVVKDARVETILLSRSMSVSLEDQGIIARLDLTTVSKKHSRYKNSRLSSS